MKQEDEALHGPSPLSKRCKGWLRGDSPWPWLAYLAVYFFPWLMRTPRAEELWLTAVILPVFLVLYLRGHGQRDRGALPYVFGITVVGLAGAPIMGTSTVFLAYAAALIGWLRPATLALKSLGTLMAAIVVVWLLADFPAVLLFPALFFPLTTGFSCLIASESAAREEALLASQATVERLAKLSERERIARDVHDLLGHHLSLVAVKANLAIKLVERDPAAATKELHDIQAMAREALSEVRATVDDLKQTSVAVEIESARAALNASDVRLLAETQLSSIPQHLERPVALIIREAVTNVVRHAAAQQCWLTVRRQRDDLLLDIRDDGSGRIEREGNGLAGIRERVRELGGRLTIQCGRGTHLQAAFPLEFNGL